MSSNTVVIKDYLFEAGKKRMPDNSGFETEENIRSNNEFVVKFFLPNGGEGPETDIMIIVNGFNEMSSNAYHHDRNGICSLLAKRRVASVLVPIPNHMNRMPKGIYADMSEPRHLVVFNKDRFYEGYRQEIADIDKLALLLKSQALKDTRFVDGTSFDQHFASTTKIHVLGYSIGGLAVLSTFLKSYIEATNLYDSCVLLSSGANFETLNPVEVIGLDEDSWKLIKHHYLGKSYLKKEPAKSLLNRIFEMVLLGEKRDVFHDHLSELSNRILVISGAMDDVSSPASLAHLEPEETGLAIIKVPSLEHPFISKGWLAWNNWILDCIVSFLQNRSKRVVKDEPYIRASLIRKFNKLILTSKSKVGLDLYEMVLKLLKKGSSE